MDQTGYLKPFDNQMKNSKGNGKQSQDLHGGQTIDGSNFGATTNIMNENDKNTDTTFKPMINNFRISNNETSRYNSPLG